MALDGAVLFAASSQDTTSVSVWEILGIIAAVGAAGGVANALLSDNGFIWPKEKDGILRPGVFGNMILGALAAVVTWGLYGPLKDTVLLGPHAPGEVAATLTLTALAGAALAGAGGARIITSEVDKRYLRIAGATAAAGQADPALATTIMTASPAVAAGAARAPTDSRAERDHPASID